MFTYQKSFEPHSPFGEGQSMKFTKQQNLIVLGGIGTVTENYTNLFYLFYNKRNM